jgi:hypothetical protein
MSKIVQVVTRNDFPTIFKQAWSKVALFQNAANGFRKTGLFPFSPECKVKTKLSSAKLVSNTEYKTRTELKNKEPDSDIRMQTLFKLQIPVMSQTCLSMKQIVYQARLPCHLPTVIHQLHLVLGM